MIRLRTRTVRFVVTVVRAGHDPSAFCTMGCNAADCAAELKSVIAAEVWLCVAAALLFSAVCVADEIGFAASDVLSTLDRPRSAFVGA